MKLSTRKFGLALAVTTTIFVADVKAAFNSYIIRNDGGGNPPVIQSNNAYVPGATEFIISAGSQKAGWGSNDINGAAIGDITSVSVTRHDDTTRFTEGTGPAVAPYFNIWITNGIGQYAVVANEPSDGAFQPLFVDNGNGSKTYDLSYADLANKPAKIYETVGGGGNTTWVHAAVGKTGQTLTFADVANFVIAAPDASYITGPNSVGTGAPRELSTNTAYGFNWVFGDTLSNYVSGAEGYVVSSPVATAVPEPAAFGLLGIGAAAMLLRRRRAN